MKIVAGLGAIDDYITFALAGADEVFIGYVPYEWNKKYGNLFPLNRREVLYYNIQVNSFEDMKILKSMMAVYKVPVTVTFNYIYYLEEQYEFIGEIIKQLMSIGFNDFIIADVALMLYLKKNSINCRIHLSGECAEINSCSMEFFNQFNISRFVFHRKNTLDDMEQCIKLNNKKNMEYEAFILNEKCHYSGAFCSSLHCDELTHLCKVQYIMGKISLDTQGFFQTNKEFEECYKNHNEEELMCNENVVGYTGCGLCELYRLKKSGITHLKVVGRGAPAEQMERDIIYLKEALNILKNSNDEKSYKRTLINNLLKKKCSKNCYY